MKTTNEGVMIILNKDGEVYGIVRKDMNSRKNVFYKCEEMSFDDLSGLFSIQDRIKED